LEREQLRTDLPKIAPGDTVRVSVKVVEGNRERIQVFEGTVMRMRGGGLNQAITVRRIASGVGVERTFMIHAPRVDKIEVVRHRIKGIRDSKVLTRRRREALYEQILDRAEAVAVGLMEVEVIDKINILQATKLAMTEAVGRLTRAPDHLVIDALSLPYVALP